MVVISDFEQHKCDYLKEKTKQKKTSVVNFFATVYLFIYLFCGHKKSQSFIQFQSSSDF